MWNMFTITWRFVKNFGKELTGGMGDNRGSYQSDACGKDREYIEHWTKNWKSNRKSKKNVSSHPYQIYRYTIYCAIPISLTCISHIYICITNTWTDMNQYRSLYVNLSFSQCILAFREGSSSLTWYGLHFQWVYWWFRQFESYQALFFIPIAAIGGKMKHDIGL